MVKNLAIIFIKLYQVTLSPLLGGAKCRFTPSCSSYAIKAIDKYGVLKGGYLAVKRVLQCHPLSAGGYDDVP